MAEKADEKREKEERERARPSLVWPVILITAGVLWLLSTTGTMEIDWWRLLRLWPVLLILGGIEIILGGRSFLANLLVAIVTVAVAVGVVFFVMSGAPMERGTGVAVDRFTEPLGGTEQARLDVTMPAGNLVIESGAGSDDLIRGELDLATGRQPEWGISRTGGRAEMALSYRGGNWFRPFTPGDSETWTVYVSPAVGLSLEAELGAGQLEVDLAGLDIRDLELQTAVGESRVTLPAEGRFAGTIRTVIGDLTVEIPRTMAAQIEVNKALTGTTLPSRFRDVGGGLYRTEGWETSDERVELTLEVIIGQITVRDSGD
jgi:hypothetical protein